MDFTNWRFPRPSSCEYQFLEMDLSPTPKRPEPNSIMDFKRDGFWIQQAKNQEERPTEVENITIFPKPVIWRKLWKDWEINSANNLQTKNTQPRQLPHDQRSRGHIQRFRRALHHFIIHQQALKQENLHFG